MISTCRIFVSAFDHQLEGNVSLVFPYLPSEARGEAGGENEAIAVKKQIRSEHARNRKTFLSRVKRMLVLIPLVLNIQSYMQHTEVSAYMELLELDFQSVLTDPSTINDVKMTSPNQRSPGTEETDSVPPSRCFVDKVVQQ